MIIIDPYPQRIPECTVFQYLGFRSIDITQLIQNAIADAEIKWPVLEEMIGKSQAGLELMIYPEGQAGSEIEQAPIVEWRMLAVKIKVHIGIPVIIAHFLRISPV